MTICMPCGTLNPFSVMAVTAALTAFFEGGRLVPAIQVGGAAAAACCFFWCFLAFSDCNCFRALTRALASWRERGDCHHSYSFCWAYSCEFDDRLRVRYPWAMAFLLPVQYECRDEHSPWRCESLSGVRRHDRRPSACERQVWMASRSCDDV